MNNKIVIKAKFVNQSGTPFIGHEYSVKLYDMDCLFVDYLGFDTLDKEGIGYISFDVEDIKSWNSPFETKPDFYFILYKNDKEIGRSSVIKNYDLNVRSNSGGRINIGEIKITE